jgi:ketosteroid isomerase-like protein
MRNNTLIAGKTAIKNHFENKSTKIKNVSLIWKPDFVDVSNSGDLGYTYGKYIYSFVDPSGETITTEGVFHTVWKRQEDGEWKFVLD